MLVFTDNKQRLRDFFAKDDVLFSYHIGDLDDFQFKHCQWAVTYGEKPYIEETILLYTGLATPTLLAFGLTGKFRPLLSELVPLLPRKFYCHFQKENLDVFDKEYDSQLRGTHHKMRLENPDLARAIADRATESNIDRLDTSHEQELLALYEKSYAGNYFERRMLESGKYFGWIESDRILAVTGVHVDTDEYKVAVLGNITTDPEHRGRGLATKLSAKLVCELVDEGKLVCLNVKTDNTPALRCYEKLGFTSVHKYDEAIFTRK